MKHLKSKLKFLVIASCILVASVAIHSCKKSSSSPSGPSGLTVSSGASDTIGKSYPLVINGSNLTGATVTTTAAGVTITNVSSTATSITATIAISSAATPGSVTLTITNSAGVSGTTTITVVAIPLIGGYASSDSVASANLIAYWPFDGNVNDVKGGLSGTGVQVTYTTGIRGQAYQGGDSVYATLVPGAAFSALPSYSLSVWYKLAAQQPSGDPGGMFFLSGTTTQNELLLETESYAPVSGDSVKIHHGFTDLGSPAYQGFTMEAYDTAAIGKWVHFVMTYNGGTSTYTVYQNAVPTGNNSAFGSNITPTLMWTDGTKTTPLGNLSFTTDPPKNIIIGTWPAGLYGVSPVLGTNGCYKGQMDELRVYNKALSQTEVAGLFLNGQAGR